MFILFLSVIFMADTIYSFCVWLLSLFVFWWIQVCPLFSLSLSPNPLLYLYFWICDSILFVQLMFFWNYVSNNSMIRNLDGLIVSIRYSKARNQSILPLLNTTLIPRFWMQILPILCVFIFAGCLFVSHLYADKLKEVRKFRA